jgi:GntR family transcriptional regulator of arabinose operon
LRYSPAYSKVRNWILDIASNPVSEVEAIPSERKISQLHGVSRDTVRRAIGSLVDEGVLESRQGMGTFINRNLMKLHKNKKNSDHTIGIIIYDGTVKYKLGGYPWIVLQSTINAVSSKGMKTQLLTLNSLGALAAKEIAAQELSGIIWISPTEKSIEIIDILKDYGIPCVIIGGAYKEKKNHYLETDDFMGGVLGGEKLLENGHNKILFVSVSDERPFSLKRYEGFKSSLAKYGVAHNPELLVSNLEVLKVYDDFRKRINNSKAPFTGIFVADGIFLKAVYNAIRDEGKTIPGDYSLVSYDETPPDECPGLDIIEVCQPLNEMGQKAVNALSELLSGKRKALVKESLPPTLSTGNSCRRIKWR